MMNTDLSSAEAARTEPLLTATALRKRYPSPDGRGTPVPVLDGIDLAALDARRFAAFRRQRIGFVFQAYNLIASPRRRTSPSHSDSCGRGSTHTG
jgi:hypothetical protein